MGVFHAFQGIELLQLVFQSRSDLLAFAHVVYMNLYDLRQGGGTAEHTLTVTTTYWTMERWIQKKNEQEKQIKRKGKTLIT